MPLVTRTISQLTTAAEPAEDDIILLGRPGGGPARGISYLALLAALASEGIGGEAADVAVAAKVLAQEAAEAAEADAAAAEAARLQAEAALAAALAGVPNLVLIASQAAIEESAPDEGGQIIPAGTKVLQIQRRAPNPALPETMQAVPYHAVRMSLADIVAAGYPARAFFRTADRFMLSGPPDAVNGGYWVNAEREVDETMFGQKGVSVAETTGLLQALFVMSEKIGRKGWWNGGHYEINDTLLPAEDQPGTGYLNITRRGPVTVKVADDADPMGAVIHSRRGEISDVILDGAPLEIDGSGLAALAVFVGHYNATRGGLARVQDVVGLNMMGPADGTGGGVYVLGKFDQYQVARCGARNISRYPSPVPLDGDGECKGVCITGAIGDEAVLEDCWADTIHAIDGRDGDGLAIFGGVDDDGLPLLRKANFIRPRVRNAQGRSLKAQAAIGEQDSGYFRRTADLRSIYNSHEFDSQYGSLVNKGFTVLHYDDESLGEGTGPTAGLVGHIPFAAQMTRFDAAGKVMHLGAGMLISGQTMSSLAYGFMGEDSPHCSLDTGSWDCVATSDLATTMFQRCIIEFNAAQLLSAVDGSLHIKAWNSRAPNTLGVVGYTGYVAGDDLSAKLSYDIDRNVTTLTPISNTRAILNLSGDRILNAPRGRIGINRGYADYMLGAVAINLANNGLPAGHSMTVYLPSSPVITGGPSGLSGDFAVVRSGGYSAQPFMPREVIVDDMTSHHYTLTGTWKQTTLRQMLTASETYDPASLATAAFTTIKTITVPGAAMGNRARATFSNNLAGVNLKAWVSEANTVSYQFVNDGGANPTDLASGTVYVFVEK